RIPFLSSVTCRPPGSVNQITWPELSKARSIAEWGDWRLQDRPPANPGRSGPTALIRLRSPTLSMSGRETAPQSSLGCRWQLQPGLFSPLVGSSLSAVMLRLEVASAQQPGRFPKQSAGSQRMRTTGVGFGGGSYRQAGPSQPVTQHLL